MPVRFGPEYVFLCYTALAIEPSCLLRAVRETPITYSHDPTTVDSARYLLVKRHGRSSQASVIFLDRR
jgi:hypothetical protein